MVVFFDIDGTIIDDDSQIIPTSAVEAIKALRKNGHIPVVNTGRPYTHIDPRIKAMDFAGYVCACGMEIYLDGQWLARRKPAPEICQKIRQAALECNMRIIYEADEATFLCDGLEFFSPAGQKDVQTMESKGFTVVEAEKVSDFRFTKFGCFPAPEDNRQEFQRRVAQWYYYIDRDTLWEFVMQGCSKAEGMLELVNYLGIPAEQTLAMGDSANDLAMFSAAKHTVCMGGGMEVLKEQAEYVTAPVLEDGLAKALRHYGLI